MRSKCNQNNDVNSLSCKINCANCLADYRELFKNYEYIDSCEETFLNKKQPDDLFLLHFNIRSLQKHIDKLSAYLANFKHQPDIVSVSETKICEGKINCNIDIYGNNFFHADSATCAGGVGLYIKNSLTYSVNKCSNLKLPNAEHLWVDVNSKQISIVVGVIYRHPSESASGIEALYEGINEVLLSLNNSKILLRSRGFQH